MSAKSEFVLQEVTELAQNLDPSRVRTLGLITKPDTLDPGSNSEQAYLRLAQSKVVVFRLGWHTLKNSGFKTRSFSSAKLDPDEEEFFHWGPGRRSTSTISESSS